jgi:hypothetical protein
MTINIFKFANVMNNSILSMVKTVGKNPHLLVLLLGLGLSSCLPEKEPEIKVGDELNGGIVSYVFRSNDIGFVEGESHGIIVAKTDLAVDSQWGCQGTGVGGTSIDVGQGKSNTEKVLAFHDNLPNYYSNPTQCHPQNDGTVAANLARELNINGETGWFVPSRGEMLTMYQNREAIGGFVEAEYWSSCESDGNRACVVSFITGQALSANKSDRKKVRVIKYF